MADLNPDPSVPLNPAPPASSSAPLAGSEVEPAASVPPSPVPPEAPAGPPGGDQPRSPLTAAAESAAASADAAQAEAEAAVGAEEVDAVLAEAGFAAAGAAPAEAASGSAGGVRVRSAEAAPFALPDLSAEDAAPPADAAQSIEMLNDVSLDVTVELGRTMMRVEDVLKLSSGDVVELDKLAGDPVEIYVNDRLLARGEVLVLNDDFCVRISEIVTPVEEPTEVQG